MHPNTYLKTFWRMELKPQIFVAMSFDEKYKNRYENIIAPAIRAVKKGEARLEPYRVDISQSGDSILTDISDGIAHCQMVLADVSSIGRDAVTGFPYRNGNVMYEVGMALASRQPSDVLLVRDDHDKFLFDVSTIPHITLNFTEVESAKDQLTKLLIARLREQDLIKDARVERAISSLSSEEIQLLNTTKIYTHQHVWGQKLKGLANWYSIATTRLLDKGIIVVAGEFEPGHTAFRFTELGFKVMLHITSGMKKISLNLSNDEPNSA